MENQMKKNNIEYEIFSAYTYKEIPEYIKNLFNSKIHKMTPGEIGCFASHLDLMMNILKRNDEAFLILEDDAVILDSLLENISKIKLEMKKNTIDRINLRKSKRSCHTKKIRIGKTYLVKPWIPSFSTAAYIISRDGIHKFIRYVEKKHDIYPIDVQFMNAFWDGELNDWEMKGAKCNPQLSSDIKIINDGNEIEKLHFNLIIKKSILQHGIIKSIKCLPISIFHEYRRKMKGKILRIINRNITLDQN